ncbi:cobalamin-5'-phosphate synthase [Balneicella halophila]|uniref:Adenosylcobinamide-GDP ribazoletransferase n=1 Tax=Balneicella halophila TaxID=1537566 RepID=A0A7L4UP69_BALHA|nr:adenosylcobinamide-GDP ribazoletransferase [Balneicella halophila]PVX50687.1 cobalamin-5'-phosphate synthase [Balneicella halophila]
MKNILAAIMFFTRIPLWKIKAFQLPAKYYENVINYWAVIGWLTSGVMILSIWAFLQIAPLPIAIVFGFVSRLLLTGALHEDGLADFFDGFGGGSTKQRILEIMKDSHIGTYGVLALILYFMIGFQILQQFEIPLLLVFIIVADTFSKYLASTMTLFLTYARTKETSKSKVIYARMHWKAFLLSSVFVILSLLLLPRWEYFLALLFPITLYFFLIRYLKKKIQGYTGDTCGALFLLCELSTWFGFLVVQNLFL